MYWFVVLLMIDVLQPLEILRNKCDSMQTQVIRIKGCGMAPWLVLVSPCFRENVIATCKSVSFLCSLDNLLQKNVFFFLFGNQN